MAKTRQSSRIAKRNSTTSNSARSTILKESKKQASKRQKLKRKPEKFLDNSDPDLSPLKGFTDEEIKQGQSQVLNNRVIDEIDDQDAIFNRLLAPECQSHFNTKNMKTYTNKKKATSDPLLLEFENVGNRDMIIKWLNDTQNCFDHAITQTQHFSPEDPFLDVPSVSQINKPAKQIKTCNKRYNLRARSLDVRVKKNSLIGRNQRKSFVGESTSMDSYKIEEVLSRDQSPVPAERVLVNMMEDQYLDNLEKEIQLKGGWKRCKAMNKTFNESRKKPKKLKVSVEATQSYNLETVENFFAKTIGTVCCDSDGNSPVNIENVLNDGRKFLEYVKKCKELNLDLAPLGSILSELIVTFKPRLSNNQFTQTVNLTTTTETQTEHMTNTIETQTGDNIKFSEKRIQTDSNVLVDTAAQTSTVNRIESATQTEDIEEEEILRTESSTPDLLLLDEIEKLEDMIPEKQGRLETQSLDYLDFNTEDIIQDANKNIIKNDDVVKPGCSNRGVKRTFNLSPIPELKETQTKRPCMKFIRDDLSVNFETQVNQEIEKEDSDGSSSQEEFLLKMMKKYDKDLCVQKKASPKPKIDETQADIEEYEEMIRNVTKPPSAPTYVDISELSNNTEVFDEAEKTLQRLEENMDYFQPEPPKSSRRCLFQNTHQTDKYSASLFTSTDREPAVGDDDLIERTLTQSNIDKALKTSTPDKKDSLKIRILQNIVVKEKDRGEKTPVDEVFSQEVDILECTPQKKKVPSFSEQRDESILDITLPPPIEFQDCDTENLPKSSIRRSQISPRRVLSVINKITSTPYTSRPHSESVLSLSPIAGVNRRMMLPKSQKTLPVTVTKLSTSQTSSSSTPSSKQKSILSFVRSSQEQQKSIRKKPCVSTTRVGRENMIKILALSRKNLITYSSMYSPTVTHMIVNTNERNRIESQTIKSVLAIAAGIWVVSPQWVIDCLAQKRLVPEEPYEALDISGKPGPRLGRLNKFTRPLLKGYKIFVSPPLASASQQEVENIIKMLGGVIVKVPDALSDKRNYICLALSEGKGSQDLTLEMYETWLETLGVVTVDLEWLTRSVGEYQVQSFRPYTLCSDDDLSDLEYPPELLEPGSYMRSTTSDN